MKGRGLIFSFLHLLSFAVVSLVLLTSCHRRALTTADNNVIVNIEIEKEIVNYQMTSMPELMRVGFFHQKGAFATHSFLPHNGGFANVLPGKTYNILTYNFGTGTTVLEEEYDYNRMTATTNEISKHYKNKLKSRSEADMKEKIVFEPDHLFVGSLTEQYVPARGAESPAVVFNLKAQTVVQSWKIIVESVKGKEWISGIAGVVTGLSAGNRLSVREKTMSSVSVFFDSAQIDETGRLEIAFNTFGYLPAMTQVVSIVITDIAGQGHEYNIDVSKQFVDNAKQIIFIKTDKIIIDEPESKPGGGGGLSPEVDEWENIEQDIII